MSKIYFELKLKNFDRATYSYKSERRQLEEHFECGEGLKNKKQNFIEIYGKGLKFSSTLKKNSLFKNKNYKKNPFIITGKKPLTINHKTGSFIDAWELLIWCFDDFKKINKNHDKGRIELFYFTEEEEEYYNQKLDKEDYDFWKDLSKNYEKYPRYFSSTSKIKLGIMMNKKDFENIKKGILNRRKPKKNDGIKGNPLKNKLLNFSKIKFEFDLNNKKKIFLLGKNGKKVSEGIIFEIKNLSFY